MLDLAGPEESSRAHHANAGKESGVKSGGVELCRNPLPSAISTRLVSCLESLSVEYGCLLLHIETFLATEARMWGKGASAHLLTT
jgi:hypothetical protein